MCAPQPAAAQVEGADFRPVEQGADPRRREAGTEIAGEISCAEAVDRHIDRDAALGSGAQRAADLPIGSSAKM